MPNGTVGNAQVADEVVLTTTSECGQTTNTVQEEWFDYDSPQPAGQRPSRNSVVRALRQNKERYERQLAQVNEAIRLIEADERSFEAYRIIQRAL